MKQATIMDLLKFKKSWLSSSAFAVIDQAWLSLISFAVSLAFIRGAAKSEYGVYLLLLTPVFLIQGIQNALFISPFSTVYPAKECEDKTKTLRMFHCAHTIFTCAACMISLLGLITYQLSMGQKVNYYLAGAFAFAVVGVLEREVSRSLQYVHGKSGTALVGDLMYGAVLLIALVMFFINKSVNAQGVLLFTGVAGIVPILLSLLGRSKPSIAVCFSSESWKELWACGRWALPGVLVTWINLSSYPYVAAASLGVSAVAEINAAKLFLMPVALCIPAWSNLVRPRFARWHANKQHEQLRDVGYWSIAIGTVSLMLFTSILVFVYPFLEQFLGPGYRGLLPLVVAWAFFFTVSFSRNVFMAMLMVNENGYRKLMSISFLSLILVVPGIFLASRLGSVWIIGMLALVEAVQMLQVMRHARSYWEAA